MNKLPEKSNRKNIRLPDFDYTSPGAYFVTISTKDSKCLFGDVIIGKMRLSAIGRIVSRCWEEIPNHCPLVTLDQFIVMPNHIHGLINIPEHTAGDACIAPTQRLSGPAKGSLGAIIGPFKSAATREINLLRGSPGVQVWQRGYYERVIRKGDDLPDIREYILNNQLRWEIDREKP
ncbi:MAG: transposase [Candidatus Glassbacteria bacterium]|nr:transposase [Candidatus Glassbacteria bacterium]